MADDSPVTLINVIELPAEQIDAFVDGWRERADFMCNQPGFRDYALHRATLPNNRFQLINVANWDSEEAFRAAVGNPTFRERIEALNNNPDLDVHANPGLYTVAVRASACEDADTEEPSRA